MRLVFTIDGGGIRGVLPLILLKEIQNRLSHNLYDLNPTWWGTSTGSIIASSLAIQTNQSFSVSVQQVLDLYEFRSKMLIQPKSTNLPERGIAQMIRANFGGLNHANFPALNIVASHDKDHNPIVFDASLGQDLGEVVMASCAFPGLFPPVKIDGSYYVDGFYKAKNPAKLAFESLGDMKSEPLVLLSFGTGVMRERDPIEDLVNEIDDYMKSVSNEKGFHYYRLNPILTNGADDMQNVSPKNIYNLRRDALDFLSMNSDLLNELVQKLQEV